MTGWEIHAARAGFLQHAEDWDRLNALLFESHPFFDSRFVGPLLEHFATGNEKLCLYRESGIVSAALIVQPLGWGRWASFRPGQAQITAILLADANLLQGLFRALPGFVWAIELIAIDPRYSANFFQSDVFALASAQAYTIGVHSGLRFDNYWGHRSKNLRANIRRYGNRLEKEFGSLTLRRITEPGDMTSGVGRYGDLESSGWKGAAGSAISGDNVQGAFYSEVMRRFAVHGKAIIYEHYVADRLAASRLMIENDTMGVILKTTYDEKLSNIAPGRMQLFRLIEDRLTNKPEQTIEFYTNATRDQTEWASFGSTIQNIIVFRGALYAHYFSLLKAIKYVLRRSKDSEYEQGKMSDGIAFGCSATFEDMATAAEISAELTQSNTVETSPGWFELLRCHVFKGDSGVRYFFVTENDEVASVLPLRLIKDGVVKKIEALSNFYTSIYSPMQAPYARRFILRHLLRAATREFGGAHVMRFLPMDPNSPAYSELMNELRAIGWIPFKFFCFGNWFLEVKESWDAYLKQRSGNLRSTIKRRSRDFNAAGGVLEVLTGSDDSEQIERGIDAYQQVYSASWKIPEPYPMFVPSLIRHLAAMGQLRLGLAYLHGKPIAAQVWICSGGKASIFKLAYDQAYASHSPGTVLTAHLLHHVIENDGVSEVDYLTGDDEYKRHWMSNRRERWGIVAYNPLSVVGLLLLFKELARRTVKSLWIGKARHESDKSGSIR